MVIKGIEYKILENDGSTSFITPSDTTDLTTSIDVNELVLAAVVTAEIVGIAIANIIDKITITANNSTNVNPFLLFFMFNTPPYFVQ
jgi:hypothetical protein